MSRTNLLALLLLISLLLTGGAANAQYEALSRVTNLPALSSPLFENLKTDILNSQFYEIKISATIDTNGDSTDPAPFGISGSSVPFVAYIVIDAANFGPGTNDGLGHFGYTGSQVIGVYFRIGPESAPNKEAGYINYPGLTATFPSVTLGSSNYQGNGGSASIWLDDDLDGGTPTAASVYLDEGSNNFRAGPLYVNSSTPGGGLYIQNSIGNYSTANVSNVRVKDISADLIEFFGDEEAATKRRKAAKKKYDQAQKKLKAAKRKKRTNRGAFARAKKDFQRKKKAWKNSSKLTTKLGISESDFLEQLGR
ncbi:MAG: hypothetical protein P1U87_02965 [Verrucomicrobiales bacterium]|nr:hypothetical protein [Verrucomicrobiales bacterium]